MQNTNSAGKRAESGNQPEKMPAKRTHSKLRRNLLVLLASVVAVAVLVIAMCLIRMHFSTNKNSTELPNNSQNNTELSDTNQNDSESSNLGQIVPELLGIWSFNGEATYSFDKERMGQLDLGDVQYAYRYTVSDDTLQMDYEDESVEDAEYQFSVEGDQLTLIGGEGTTGGTYQLSRAD